MKKKGFTLIELLAVIIILAVIALIATPVVLNVVDNARKEANKNSAYGLLDATKLYYAESLLDSSKQSNTNGTTNLIDEIKASGKGPKGGEIYINSVGQSAIAVIYDDVCYKKNFEENTITESEDTDNCKVTQSGSLSLSAIVKLGDYISMTPTSTPFTADTSKTGYASTQTINPSELNLWRVISINSDGTIDMVSENVSSTKVYFQDQTGYKNIVGYLNEIADQYQNTNYTIAARHIGYNGQTEYLTDTADTVDSTSTTAPWTSSTGSSTVESQGGGDKLYTTDTDLVKNVLGTLKAYNPSGTATDYWLASRYYYYSSSLFWGYYGRIVNASGSIRSSSLYIYSSGFNTCSSSSAVRPIVTLKSGLQAIGSGTGEDPYVLP